MLALSAFAYILAAFFKSSAGTPEIFSTFSGVYFSTAFFKASNPSVLSFT